jgi:hypothetical protein
VQATTPAIDNGAAGAVDHERVEVEKSLGKSPDFSKPCFAQGSKTYRTAT